MPVTNGPEEDSDFAGNSGKLCAIYVCGLLAVAIILSIVEQLGARAETVQFSLVLFTLVTYALIGFVARTSSPEGYFVAGRSNPPRYNGMAVAAQWTSLTGFLGLTGTLYALGYDGLAYLIGLIGGFVLMAVLIVPYLRKLGATTVPDYFGARFGAVPRLLAVVVLVISSLAILVAQYFGIGLIASRYFAIPYEWAVAAACAVVVLSTLFGGMRAATGTQAAQYIVLIIAFLVPAAWLAMKSLGWPLPQLIYGEALQQIATLETGMIEKSLASADTLKPHVAPFLQLDPLNFAAIVFCLMAGVASLPHLLTPQLTVPTVRDARLSVAWSAFFALLLAMTIPAYAALAKLQVYRLIEKGTAFVDLPPWIESYSQLDLVRIHGVSLRMLTDAAAAVKTGAADTSALAAHLKTHSPETFASFVQLKESAKSAVLEAAKSTGVLDGTQPWDAFRQSVLPAAAKAAGNKTGMLTESGLWIEPASLVFAMPNMAAMPAIVTGLVAAGALAAALATATGVLMAIANALAHDIYYKLLDRRAPDGRRLAVSRLLLLSVAAGAAYGALKPPAELLTVAGWAFSLAASGLFPALVLGIWWKRANVWGATAGMIAGFGLCLYYMIATQFFPVAFYELWAPLAPAGDTALRKLASLQSVWSAAEGDAKATALAVLEAHARGTATNAGIANWFGILNSSAALFAVPLGFLVIALISLITPKPWPETIALVEEMRRPKGAEILSGAPD